MTKINIKKSKITTTIIATLMIGLVLLSPMMLLPNVKATTDSQNLEASSSGCVDKVQQEAQSKSSIQDKARAISLASNQNEFKSKIKGYTSTFNSVFNEWSFDANCNLIWKDVGVAYTLSNATGVVKNVVVLVDPSLTKVLNVTEQVTGRMGTSTNWDGYEFYKQLTPTTVNVWEAKATWSQTTVTQPAPGYCVPSLPSCAISTWPGLSHYQGGGSTDLAQAGTTGQITCGHSGCNILNYFAWYEFLPANYVTCPSITLHPGDSISSDVVNQAKTGGSSTLYNISVVDSTYGTMCTVNSYSYSVPAPLYAEFINERPIINVLQSLPRFTPITMTGTMYYSGGTHSISEPYNAGTLIESIMTNSGNKNISHTGASTGSFTATFLTAAGT